MKDYQICRNAYRLYKATYYESHDMGCSPVCFDEFYNNEWQEPDIKSHYKKLLKKGQIPKYDKGDSMKKNKTADLSKCTIDYGGKKYQIDLYGREDYDAPDGLWALSAQCAEFVLIDLDDKIAFDTEEQGAIVHEAVRDAVYSLIKFRLLRPLNQQIAGQKPSQM